MKAFCKTYSSQINLIVILMMFLGRLKPNTLTMGKEVLVMGHLIAKAFVVPRSCLHASIHRVDPVNTAERRSRVAVRRIYNVGELNEVWHFDGYHKFSNIHMGALMGTLVSSRTPTTLPTTLP